MEACGIFVVWAAATGVFTHYEFVLDETFVEQTMTNTIEICIEDGEVHTFAVRAVTGDSAGSYSFNSGTLDELGPPGAPALVTPTATATPTGTPTAAPTPWPRPPNAVCADFVGKDGGPPDGVVGWADFGIFSQLYGTRNDGVKEVP